MNRMIPPPVALRICAMGMALLAFSSVIDHGERGSTSPATSRSFAPGTVAAFQIKAGSFSLSVGGTTGPALKF